MSTAQHCGKCGAPFENSERQDYKARACQRCGAYEDLTTGAVATSLVLRKKKEKTEVLLCQLNHTWDFGGGLWCLPGGKVPWSEEVRETARRTAREQTGLQIEVLDPYDARSSFEPDTALAVVTCFRCEAKEDAKPRPGPRVDRAEFFPLDSLPDLAFETDGLILGRLGREEDRILRPKRIASLESVRSELEGRLTKRRKQYNQLMELYMQELMRGAWINNLLVKMTATSDIEKICELTVTHLTEQADLGLVRLWLPGPPDRCEDCDWAATCEKVSCLHLAGEAGSALLGPLHSSERIPPTRGTPAGDIAASKGALSSEVERPGARPSRFEGFPLDLGQDFPGVLGIFSSEIREAGERRLFQFVARYLGAAIKNARLHEELRRSDQVKRIFIDKMSHELKTPLTVILGYAELLKEDRQAEGDEIGMESSAAIEKSGRDLFTLVESILFMTKLASGQSTPRCQRIVILPVLERVMEKYDAKARAKGLQIELAGGEEAAWADPEWVHRIVSELVENAIRFTERGTIKIAIEDRGDEGVTVGVHDTGIGIGKTNQMRIFEAFTQGTQVTDDYQVNLHYGGLGIGLAIAQALVELLKGRLWVESSLGSGSHFYFNLPRSSRSAPSTRKLDRDPAKLPGLTEI